jgi:hypothetical protein
MANMKLPETSRRNPVGRQSHPIEPGQRSEASLASVLATVPSKRRQRWRRTMLLSPEISVAGALIFSCGGGRGGASKWPDALGPAGVVGTGWASTGVPQEQERPVVSARRIGPRVVPNPKRPGPRLCAADRRERIHAVQLAVPPGEPNEAGGKDGQGSECLHSTETRVVACSPHGPRGAN